MLSSLKDKLLTVTKNVPLFSSGNHANNKQEGNVQSELNLNAGSQILSHYQNEWETLHRVNEENAKEAEKVAEVIDRITNKIDRDRKSLVLMTQLLAQSNLEANVENCTKDIKALFDSFILAEEELQQLEDIIENVEFEKMKKRHRYHLQQHIFRKSASLQNFEDILKEDYDKAANEHEIKKKIELEERQKVFHEAFKTDLEIFKNSGTIPKLDIQRKQPSALLEEIQVDFDERELNQFFEETPI